MPKDPSSQQQPPNPRFERAVLLITVLVWLGHFALNSVLGAITQTATSTAHALLLRLASYLLAIASCWLVHLLVRSHRSASLRFAILVLASVVPTAMVVSYLTYISLVAFSYGRELSLAGMAVDYVRYVLWIYLTWAALYVATTYVFEIQRKERRIAAAENAAAQAQLMALRLQIAPHFLFNTLDTVAGLVSLDRKEQAEATLVHLSAFLRHTLSTTAAPAVPLEAEVDFIEQYLSIERIRFSDRLEVRYAVDRATRKLLVPSLLLLPIVENAIKHGLRHSEGSMMLEIGASMNSGCLRVWVENTGGGKVDHRVGFGIGLKNVGERLEAMFGADASLDANPLPTGWRTVISIRLEG